MRKVSKQEAIDLIKLELAAREKALELVDKIIAIVPKFDGKVPNKRLDAALKEIDKDLRFTTHYNSFKIELYIEARSCPDSTGQGWNYIDNSTIYLVHACIESGTGDGICQNGTINGGLLIAELERFRAYTKKEIEKTQAELSNIDTMILEYATRKKAIEDFVNSTSHLTRNYFKLGA